MTQKQAEYMAIELGLILKVLHNGFQFKRKNQIVTIYKRKWHYNLAAHDSQWKNFNNNHEDVLRRVFKPVIEPKPVIETQQKLSDKGVSACIKHVERKLAKYMDLHPGKIDNELCVMLKNLILEFDQYTYGNLRFIDIKSPSFIAQGHAYSIQQSAYNLLKSNAETKHGIDIEERAKEDYQSYLAKRPQQIANTISPAMIPPYCQVGTLVSLNTSFLCQPVGTKCLVYHVDKRGAAAIISEKGIDFGYFHEEEIVEYLEFLKHTQLNYKFISVMRLMEDFRHGTFEQYFK